MGAECSTPKEQHTNGSEAMEMYLASPNTKEAKTWDTKREQVLRGMTVIERQKIQVWARKQGNWNVWVLLMRA